MSNSYSPKKILFVTRPLSPPWDEASKNFAFDLACKSKDHMITILVDKEILETPSHITQKKIYTHNQFSLVQKIRLMCYVLKHASDYDIVHLLFTPTKINSFIMRVLLANKTCKVIQTIATLRDDLYSPTELKKMFFGDVLVTYSRWAQTKLHDLQFKNVTQIYPGINLLKFIPGQKNTELMKKWHITPEDQLVTYPGEFMRLGATDLIIDTFLDLWKDHKNAHIKYICACRIKNEADEKKKQEVIKRIMSAGHQDKVIFTDTYNDMNAIYNLSDIIIFPVTNMNGKFDVPLAMIEPYACKKPVIATSLPLFAEFSHSDINVIIPAANKQNLTDAIVQLLADPDKQKKLGEHAYTFAHKTFNIERTAQSYGKIYKNL